MCAAMSLATFRTALNLSQARLAVMLTEAGFPATQSLISQWEVGAVAISAERALQIERVTQGGITRAQIRPDIFGPIEQGNSHAA